MLKSSKRFRAILAGSILTVPLILATPIALNSYINPISAYAQVIDTTNATTYNISKQTAVNNKISINITKDGKYVFTGSNYIGGKYIPTEIKINEGVTADIVFDGLSIRNEVGSVSNRIPTDCVYPLLVYGKANLYIKSTSSFNAICDDLSVLGELNIVGSASNASLDLGLLTTGARFTGSPSLYDFDGKININGGTVNFNLSNGQDNIYCDVIINDGHVNFNAQTNSNLQYYSHLKVNGGIVSGYELNKTILSPSYAVKNSDNKIVYKASLASLPKSSQVLAINGNNQSEVYTDSSGKLENIYLPREAVTVYVGSKAYTYNYNSSSKTFTLSKTENAYTVNFVLDGSTICTYHIIEGNTVPALPSSDKYDYTFTANGSTFSKSTAIKANTTVNVTKKIKSLKLNVDGTSKSLTYGTAIPSGYLYFDDDNKLYSDSTITKNLTAYKAEIIDNEYYFPISTASDFIKFTELVNVGYDNCNINATLKADIDLSGKTINPIGHSILHSSLGDIYSYIGTFNGNNHTISNVTINNSEEGVDVGLFSNLLKAKISYLGVNNITIKNSNSNYTAGFIGSANNSHIEYCYATNVNLTADSDSSAGFIGYDYLSTIENCYTDYALFCVEGEYNSNCYCLKGDKSDGDSYTIQKDINAFKNGEVCYLLNKNGVVYKQTIGTDSRPTLIASHKTVYPVYKDCTKTSAIASYTNDTSKHITKGHGFKFTKKGTNAVTATCAFCDFNASLELKVFNPNYFAEVEHKIATLNYSDNWNSDNGLTVPDIVYTRKSSYTGKVDSTDFITAGTINVAATVKESSSPLTLSADYEIKRAKPVAHNLEFYNKKYDGNAHKMASYDSVPDSTKVYYSMDSGKTWTETCPEFTKCFNSTLTMKIVKDDPNYEPNIIENEVSIIHNPSQHSAKAPTCTEEGNVYYSVCECGNDTYKDISKNVIENPFIPAKGHSFKYASKENDTTISVVCANDKTHIATATISANNVGYDGSEKKTATITYNEYWTKENGLDKLNIIYEGDTKNIGTVIAKATYNDYTIQAEYNITANINGDANNNGVLDKNDAEEIMKKVLDNDYTLEIEKALSDWKGYLDMDNDNEITATDAVIILSKLK